MKDDLRSKYRFRNRTSENKWFSIQLPVDDVKMTPWIWRSRPIMGFLRVVVQNIGEYTGCQSYPRKIGKLVKVTPRHFLPYCNFVRAQNIHFTHWSWSRHVSGNIWILQSGFDINLTFPQSEVHGAFFHCLEAHARYVYSRDYGNGTKARETYPLVRRSRGTPKLQDSINRFWQIQIAFDTSMTQTKYRDLSKLPLGVKVTPFYGRLQDLFVSLCRSNYNIGA